MIWLIFFLFVSCSSSDSDGLRKEGEEATWRLAKLLQTIDRKEALIEKIGQIKKSYAQIADLALRIDVADDDTDAPSEASEVLFIELARLYEMPGCRQLLEEAQKESIAKLRRQGL